MSSLRDRVAMDRGPWRKWTPAVAAAALVAALTAGGSIMASARTDLPDRTPQDVLEMIAAHEVEGFSGRLEASVDLGLPPLPAEGTASEDAAGGDAAGGDAAGGDATGRSLDGRLAELLSLLPGTHDARVFVNGHDRFRLQLLDGAEEKNLVRDGAELWFYDSAEDRAVHTELPRHPGEDGQPLGRPHHDVQPPTPARIAERLLEKAGEHSTVSVEEGTSDSGRAAYVLRLDPRTEQTLVDTVSVHVDAQTGMVLGLEVLAVGQDEPAISVVFTQFTPQVPDAGLFDFQPPAGATVQEATRPEPALRHGGHRRGEETKGEDAGGEVVGEGWGAVVVLPAGSAPAELTDSALLDQLAVEVEGGRLLSTPLLTVLLTDDGRVLAGPVPQQRLLDVAAGTGEE